MDCFSRKNYKYCDFFDFIFSSFIKNKEDHLNQSANSSFCSLNHNLLYDKFFINDNYINQKNNYLKFINIYKDINFNLLSNYNFYIYYNNYKILEQYHSLLNLPFDSYSQLFDFNSSFNDLNFSFISIYDIHSLFSSFNDDLKLIRFNNFNTFFSQFNSDYLINSKLFNCFNILYNFIHKIIPHFSNESILDHGDIYTHDLFILQYLIFNKKNIFSNSLYDSISDLSIYTY